MNPAAMKNLTISPKFEEDLQTTIKMLDSMAKGLTEMEVASVKRLIDDLFDCIKQADPSVRIASIALSTMFSTILDDQLRKYRARQKIS